MHASLPVFRGALLLALGVLAGPACAGGLEVQAGRSYMDGYGAGSVFVEGILVPRPIGDGFSWSPDLSLGWIDGRDIARYRYSRVGTDDAVWLLAAGARFHYGKADDWYQSLFFSFQPAWQSGRTQALSSGYEFVTTVGWQGRRFSLQIRHVSNGGLRTPNRGETMALVGVAFDL